MKREMINVGKVFFILVLVGLMSLGLLSKCFAQTSITISRNVCTNILNKCNIVFIEKGETLSGKVFVSSSFKKGEIENIEDKKFNIEQNTIELNNNSRWAVLFLDSALTHETIKKINNIKEDNLIFGDASRVKKFLEKLNGEDEIDATLANEEWKKFTSDAEKANGEKFVQRDDAKNSVSVKLQPGKETPEQSFYRSTLFIELIILGVFIILILISWVIFSSKISKLSTFYKQFNQKLEATYPSETDPETRLDEFISNVTKNEEKISVILKKIGNLEEEISDIIEAPSSDFQDGISTRSGVSSIPPAHVIREETSQTQRETLEPFRLIEELRKTNSELENLKAENARIFASLGDVKRDINKLDQEDLSLFPLLENHIMDNAEVFLKSFTEKKDVSIKPEQEKFQKQREELGTILLKPLMAQAGVFEKSIKPNLKEDDELIRQSEDMNSLIEKLKFVLKKDPFTTASVQEKPADLVLSLPSFKEWLNKNVSGCRTEGGKFRSSSLLIGYFNEVDRIVEEKRNMLMPQGISAGNQQAIEQVYKDFQEDLISFMDSLYHNLGLLERPNSVVNSDITVWIDALNVVKDNWEKYILKAFGLEPIAIKIGRDRFNEELHKGVDYKVMPEYPENTIINVIQYGYRKPGGSVVYKAEVEISRRYEPDA